MNDSSLFQSYSLALYLSPLPPPPPPPPSPPPLCKCKDGCRNIWRPEMNISPFLLWLFCFETGSFFIALATLELTL